MAQPTPDTQTELERREAALAAREAELARQQAELQAQKADFEQGKKRLLGRPLVAVDGPLCYNRRKTKENDHGRME